ncbi:hypothetical protein D0T24_05035 [Duganella sp. BJB480]|uniref:hypothetical protein n=1 Tax=unclassified Duganella TaxID=2636909 RepID=UPI000E340C53|nr:MULTISPECIES: hypothetical protein [unclassified Duganella]RFP17520.1 hypothetical protein D0T26_14935 [Duganella sp. BJB489]RFP37364.1 hypothetical protein D0T24_05035 [Duganella sp. BJB480]
MTTITLVSDAVAGQCEYQYSPTGGIVKHCLVMSQIEHRLRVDTTAAGLTVTELSGGAGRRRLQLTARGAGATLNVVFPDLNGQLPPAMPPDPAADWDCRLTGNVVLLEEGSDANVAYRIEVGMLKCEPGRKASVRVLNMLWPVIPPRNTAWSYLWTPLGLAIESTLTIDNIAHPATLLLPAARGAAKDVAWNPSDDGASLQFWKADASGDFPEVNAIGAAGARLTPLLPRDKPWPGPAPTMARRWRLLEIDQHGLLDMALAILNVDPYLTLERHAPAVGKPGTVVLDEPAMAAELWTAVELQVNKQVLAGAVLTSLRDTMAARIRWNAASRSATMQAANVHVSLAPDGESHRLLRHYLTLSNGPRSKADLVQISWNPLQQESPQATQIGRAGMLFAGMSPSPDSPQAGGLPGGPRWIKLADGYIDLVSIADPAQIAAAKARLQQASYDGGSLDGGVPLGEIGGPAGMTALMADASADGKGRSSAWLRIRKNKVQLELSGAYLLWETPAWWIADRDAAAASGALPNLAPGFSASFKQPDASVETMRQRLSQALSAHLNTTHWIGKMGQPGQGEWIVEKTPAGTTLTLPSGLAKQCRISTPIGDAALLSLLPYPGVDPSALLLDGSRGTTPLVAPKQPVVLVLRENALPALAAPAFPSVESAPAQWTPIGGEMFDPRAWGLGYHPARQEFDYRHAAQMATETQLRIRPDGSLGQQISGASPAAVRAADDIAIWTSGTPGSPSPRFSLSGGATKGPLSLRGWIPGSTVGVKQLKYQSPTLTLTIVCGKDQKDEVTLDMSLDGRNQQPVPLSLRSDDGEVHWLERAVAGNFVGYGQPLQVAGDFSWFADGRSRWQPYAAGVRPTKVNGVAQNLLTFNAFCSLGLYGGDPSWQLGISVCDQAPGSPALQWDMLGDGEAPRVGPFALLSHELTGLTPTAFATTLRLGLPFASRHAASASATGLLTLQWNGAPDVLWQIADGDCGDFCWRIEAPTYIDDDEGLSARISLREVLGRASIVSGKLLLTLTAVGLQTELGLLRISTLKQPILMAWDDDGVESLAFVAESEADAATGFHCRIPFRCRRQSAGNDPAPWYIPPPAQGGTTAVCWAADGGTLSLPSDPRESMQLNDLVLHLAAAPCSIPRLSLHQSSTVSWGFTHVEPGIAPAQAVSTAIAGSITVIQGSLTPLLEWRVRASVAIDAAELFGRVKAGTSLRADVRLVCAGPLTVANRRYLGSSMTGRVAIANDCQLKYKGTIAVDHHCQLIVDQLPLTTAGTPGDSFDAVVAHTLQFGVAGLASFQTVQHFSILTVGGATHVQSSCVLMLVPLTGQPPMALAQIQLAGAPPIGIALAAHLPPAVQGYVLRIALRNTGTTLSLPVPAAVPGSAIQLFPLAGYVPMPRQDSQDTEVWHARGPLADMISTSTLAELTAMQRAAKFKGGDFPQANETLSDWAGILETAGRFQSAMLPSKDGTGVIPMPFWVDSPGDKGLALSVDQQERPRLAVTVELLLMEARGVQSAAAAPLASAAVATISVGIDGAADSVDAANASIQAWARQELRRLSARSVAATVVRGRPEWLASVPRSFFTASVCDVDQPRKLLAPSAAPAISQIADDTATIGATGWQERASVSQAPEFVLEALCSRPVQQGQESGRTTRLASQAFVGNDGRTSEVPAGGVAVRQSVAFEQQLPYLPPARDHLALYRMHQRRQDEASVHAPVVDVIEWAARPGDTLESRFSVESPHAVSGPASCLSMRTARPANGAYGDPLSLDDSITLRWDGVDWAMHRVSSSRVVGKAGTGAASTLLLTVVTPNEARHENYLPTGGGDKSLPLQLQYVRKERKNATGDTLISYLYDEPLLLGLFTDLPALPVVELVLMRPHGVAERITPEPIASALADPKGWRTDPNKYSCLLLRRWDAALPVPGNAKLEDASAYDAESAQLIKSLLEATEQVISPKGEQTMPWLMNTSLESSPRFAILTADDPQGLRKIAGSVALSWQETCPSDLLEKLLVLSDKKVVGYGDLAGTRRLILEATRNFVLKSTCYALEARPLDRQAAVEAFRFNKSGVCTAQASRP